MRKREGPSVAKPWSITCPCSANREPGMVWQCGGKSPGDSGDVSPIVGGLYVQQAQQDLGWY